MCIFVERNLPIPAVLHDIICVLNERLAVRSRLDNHYIIFPAERTMLANTVPLWLASAVTFRPSSNTVVIVNRAP